jgi:hypothetical protein
MFSRCVCNIGTRSVAVQQLSLFLSSGMPIQKPEAATHVVEEVLYPLDGHMPLDEIRDTVDDVEERRADQLEARQSRKHDRRRQLAPLHEREVPECDKQVGERDGVAVAGMSMS